MEVEPLKTSQNKPRGFGRPNIGYKWLWVHGTICFPFMHFGGPILLTSFDPNGCYIILCPNFLYRPRGFNARKQCWSARQTCHVRAYRYIWTCLWHLPCTLRQNATVIHLCMKSPCTTGSLGVVLGTHWIPKRTCKCLVTITYIL